MSHQLVPTLTLLALSDSFSAMWPELATECGLTLVMTTEPSALSRLADSVGVVSGAGVEDRLSATFRQIVPASGDVAAVGSIPEHRLAVGVIRAGASEYFALPQDMALLRSWLNEGAGRLRNRASRAAFTKGEEAKYRFEEILGGSNALHSTLRQAARVIPHANVTVLIAGETGTGKELLARAIHYNGPRRDAPFVDVNCAAIPEQLLESELFGHEKGAFTDATSAKPGLFEVANGGTLFLDEIGHLPLSLQGKILRAIEERTIRRVGGTRNIPTNVRIISASHVDLAGAVRRKEFREDLFYRLNVVPMHLPPLRERREDILPLAWHFLTRFAKEYKVPEPRLTAGAERALAARPWPGNIRELRNAVERAILLGSGSELDAQDFAAPDDQLGTNSGNIPFPAPLGAVVHGATVAMLELCGGNKSEAARRLGISRARLQRVLDGGPDDSDYSRGDE